MVNIYIYYNTHTHTHTHTYIYLFIYLFIYKYKKIAVNLKRYTCINQYPKYIVPLTKPIQPSVRY